MCIIYGSVIWQANILAILWILSLLLNIPPMPTSLFLAELLITILTAYPALANSLILLSSSPSCLPNMAYIYSSYRARVNTSWTDKRAEHPTLTTRISTFQHTLLHPRKWAQQAKKDN
ncbi:Uncharacterized protein HZ326_30334 [Fusarium oxysporum f. sp. albedinis]|nr:Uncharacterized protein HZ326_30334 [Fusarium oxysporum f. sp. albedinis]